MNNSRRQSMTVSNQPGKPRLSEQRLAADLEEFQKSGGAIERLGDTPLRRERSVARRRPRLQQLRRQGRRGRGHGISTPQDDSRPGAAVVPSARCG